MKNEEILKKVAGSVNTMINTAFHIASQFNSEAFYDLIQEMEANEFKQLLPSVSDSKIDKAIEDEKQIEFLVKNGITGWIAEVYHAKVVGYDGSHYSIKENDFHTTIIHDLNYNRLVNRVLKISEKVLKEDLRKIKRREENGTK